MPLDGDGHRSSSWIRIPSQMHRQGSRPLPLHHAPTHVAVRAEWWERVSSTSFVYYNKCMAIEFTDSAARHGFTRDDAIHAMQTPETFAPHYDHSRTGGPDVAAWIGPARGGRTIEVFATLTPPDTVVVFHCMDVRPSTIAKLNGERA